MDRRDLFQLERRGSAHCLLAATANYGTTSCSKNQFYLLIERSRRMLTTVLIVLLILMMIGAMPTWGYSRNWGAYPSGGIGLIVVILIILLLMQRI
jgi:hypothetical protein